MIRFISLAALVIVALSMISGTVSVDTAYICAMINILILSIEGRK